MTMNSPDRDAPPAADPRPGHNAGYDETHPRDAGDVRPVEERLDTRGAEDGRLPNPDVGGLTRDPEVTPDPTEH